MGKHTLKCLVCGQKEKQSFGLKYFSVPTNSERRAKWLNSINKSHLIQTKFTTDLRVCERHFTENMYSKSKFRLKMSATPSLDIMKNVSNENSEVILNETENLNVISAIENTQVLESSDRHVDEENYPTIKADPDDCPNQSIEAEISEENYPTIKADPDDCSNRIIEAEISDSPVDESIGERTFQFPVEETERASTKHQSFKDAEASPINLNPEDCKEPLTPPCYMPQNSSSDTSEIPQHNDGSANDSIRDESMHYNLSVDQYSVYGENIAHRLRNCQRNNYEIFIAQRNIDEIIFKLSMGCYSPMNAQLNRPVPSSTSATSSCSISIPSTSTPTTSVPDTSTSQIPITDTSTLIPTTTRIIASNNLEPEPPQFIILKKELDL